MGRLGAKRYRIKSKMVHLDLLRGIKETSILTDSSKQVLQNGHKDKTLPFPSILIEGAYLFYIPTYMLRTVERVKDLGVTKVMSFLRHLDKEGLVRMMEEDFDWSLYNLTEWK